MKKYIHVKAIFHPIALICVCAVVLICAGLSACGEKTGAGGDEPSVVAAETGKVYRINSREILPWVDSENPYISVKSAAISQEGICAVIELREWVADRLSYGVLTADEELSELQVVTLQSPEAVTGKIEYRRFAVTEDNRIYGLYNGEATQDSGTTQDSEAGVDGTQNDDGMQDDEAAQGSEPAYDSGTTHGSSESEVILLCCWDSCGNLLWETELSDACSGGKEMRNFYARGLYVAQDGSVDLLFGGDAEYRLHISRDGQPSSAERLSEQTKKIFANCLGIWSGENDSLQVLYLDEKNREKTYLADYEMDTDTFGEPWELPFTFAWGETEAAAMVEGGLVYAKEDGIWTCGSGDAQGTKQMDYINSDINVTGVDVLLEMDGERFLAFYRENHQTTLKVGVFSSAESGEMKEKQVLVLGGSYIDEAMRQRVVEFNRASEDYRIVLKQYDYDENSGTYLQLNLDIGAGKMPDILLAAGLPVESLIEKGLAADIKPLIEGDAELSRREFMSNVFDAYSVDGKLMYVVPEFMVATMVAKTSLVGDAGEWDLEKAERIFDGMGEGTQFISEITRDAFIDRAMLFCGRDLVDMETGKCFFDTEEFIALMEFASALPEEIDRDTLYEGDYWEEYDAQYRNNRTFLKEARIDYLDQYVSYELNSNMGEDFRFVGFPRVVSKDSASAAAADVSQNGAYIYSDDLMVLSANSAHLEIAWEFVRYYLTEEYQSSLGWGLPVDKNIFMEQTGRLTERPYYTDENGVKVEYDDTFYYQGEDIPIPPMTQEQVNGLVAHIESINRTAFVNDEIMGILHEELGSYFAGQKKAEDVAALIQNRVQLILNERR